MKLPNDGNTQPNVDNNQEYVLLLIGEPCSLLNNNQVELGKIPGFREALEQFMLKIEEISGYPWIGLLWESEVET